MSGHKMPDDPGELVDIGGKLRLFVEAPLEANARIRPDTGQTHYLLHVMRARAGDRVLLFNGRDGEWRAQVADVSRRECALVCEAQIRAQQRGPDLWLAFAPVKKTPGEYLAQKATELGVAMMIPVITERTVARRVNAERLRANAIEAAEQSERLTVPEIRDTQSLPAMLDAWPAGRGLIFCDEAGDALPIAEALAASGPWAGWGVLTGPEGGFAPSERDRIRAQPFVVPVSLGPRIMRADTAALAALAVWQAVLGDWH
ncbi:MAG TPA: 16S rRNA (uracil(1498)-N(3))-methyltransferase [Micropepsaceae bacterium]|nr:16S rRNA (uracil(1498)-N(3))-methyltransferase [Micropepsaceae bacterium]